MKNVSPFKTILALLFACIWLGIPGQILDQGCQGESKTISISNVQNLSNPAYSLNPGGITSPNGVWTVTLQSSIAYFLYVTGTNSNNVVVTNSISVSYNVYPTPTLTTVQSQQNFTIGCGSFSVVSVTIAPTPQPQSVLATTYSILPAGATPTLMGQWGFNNIINVTAPGNYKAMAFFAGTPGCCDSVSFSIASNTTGPVFDSVQVSPGISCTHPSVTIHAFTNGNDLHWEPSFLGPPVTGPSYTAYLAGNYTLFATNPANGCTGYTMIPVPDQQVYPVVLFDSLSSLCNATSVAVMAAVVNSAGDDTLRWFNEIGQMVAQGSVFTATAIGVYILQVTNQYGCSTMNKLIIVDCTGLRSATAQSIQCWPNPVVQELEFFFPDKTRRKVYFYTTSGMLVKEAVAVSGDALDVTDLPAGVYHVVCGEKSLRLVKM